MNKFINLKKPFNLLIAVFSSIILFYIINLLFLSKYLKGNVAQLLDPNFSAGIIQFFSGNRSLIDIFMNSKDSDYAPLYFINLLMPLYVFGRNWVLMVVAVHTFYLLMLLVFTYLLGKELLDEKTGLVAAVLVSLYPVTWMCYRIVCVEFPLLGIMAMSVYFLYRSKCFSNLKWSMLFALACAWGMWIKDVYGAFIIGPIIYGFYKSLITLTRKRDVQPVLNFLAFATTFYVVIHPYYFEGLLELNYWTLIRPFEEITGFSWYSFENIRPFLYGYWEAQYGLLFFVVLIAGIYYFIRSVKFDKERDTAGSNLTDLKIMLLLWIIVPTLMVFLMPHQKTARYLIQEASAMAIISAFLVRRLLDKKLGLIILIMLISFSVFRYYRITYNINTINIPFTSDGVALQYIGHPVRAISAFDKIKLDLLDEIKKIQMRDVNKKRFIITTIDSPFIFIDFTIFLWFNGIDTDDVQEIRTSSAVGYFKETSEIEWFRMLFEKLDNPDFLVVVNDRQHHLDLYNFETIKNLFSFNPNIYKTFNWGKHKSVFEEKMSKFKVRKRYEIPGHDLDLYIRE